MEQEESAYQRIRHKIPFAHSVYLARNKAYTSSLPGRRLRSTFLSGGCLYVDQTQHYASLAHKALDISNGVILTDVDIAYCDEGIRVHFELDYRTYEGPFPTAFTFETHLQIIHTLVKECYPHETDLTMWVATCEEKRKFSRAEPHRPKLAWGAHVVFPSILASTELLKRMAQVIDTRLSHLCDGWVDIVDTSSYRRESATLRPCHSYKSAPCLACKSQPNTIAANHDVPCDCQGGRRLDPSIYAFWGRITPAGQIQREPSPSIEDTLRQMTIVAPPNSQLSPRFHMTVDMESVLQNNVARKPSKTTLTMKKTPRHATLINPRDTPNGHKVLRLILGRLHPDYSHVAVDRIHVDKYKVMTISVKGRGSHSCPYVGREHTSNRIYFVLQLQQSTVSIKCYSRQCRALTNVITKPLTLVEKYELVQGFKIETGAYHRTKAVFPPTTKDLASGAKKTIWEERMLLFLKEKKEKEK
jgi:hypothetical protein